MQQTLVEVKRYLEVRTGGPVQVEAIQPLGEPKAGGESLKQFGYGRPIYVAYRAGAGGDVHKIVLHTIRRNAFGREREADRVAAVWLDYQTFNRLPRHVPAHDILVRLGNGELKSIAGAEKMLLVTGYTSGSLYADDLTRIRDTGSLTHQDIERAEALAAYLAQIHQLKHSDPLLWQRRLRDLIGHGEGIMGITDSYPLDQSYITGAELRELEDRANHWRWRLKPFSHRLCQVHGDFHPFNILFNEGPDFWVLDRSRGEWGEPADDLSCMAINYLFFALQHRQRFEGPFAELHDRFWESYFASCPDGELARVVQPWFAWRALVVASPVWYPTIGDRVRRKLLTFARQVLHTEEYDYRQVNKYLEAD